VRVGLVGFGSMGQNHARVLDSMNETRLAGIFDPNYSGKSLLFENLNCSSIDQLVNLGLDYCVIATPTTTHVKIACELSQHRVNLLIEKPIATDSDSAQQIIDYVDSNKIKAAVGHVERFNSAMIEAGRRIGLGQLGIIYQIFSSRQGPTPIRVKDVGVITDLATHDIDSIIWLTKSQISKVSAEVIKKKSSTREDGLFLIGELKNGVKISMVINWMNPIKERKTTIVGENGTFVVDTLNSTLVFYENSAIDLSMETISNFVGVSAGNVHQYAFKKTEALKTEHSNMINYIRGYNHDSCSVFEAKYVVDVINLITNSAEFGQTVYK
jgi:UDP-N-acetylglucosamine 3-dehydrogenase